MPISDPMEYTNPVEYHFPEVSLFSFVRSTEVYRQPSDVLNIRIHDLAACDSPRDILTRESQSIDALEMRDTYIYLEWVVPGVELSVLHR